MAHLHLWYSETENCLDFLDSLTGLCGLVAPREDGCSCGASQLMMWMDTLPETNSSPLKMDGWNTILSYWGPAYFQGRLLLVSRRVRS